MNRPRLSADGGTSAIQRQLAMPSGALSPSSAASPAATGAEENWIA